MSKAESRAEERIAAWTALLADAYAVIERTGDRVMWVAMRPDVHAETKAMLDTVDGEETLWGAVVTMVGGQAKPFLMGGEVHKQGTDQHRWLDKTFVDLTERGAQVTRIQIEAVGEGGAFTLTGEWPGTERA